MISSRELENKRKSHRSILGVVKAMKALSAANVRKGANALDNTRRYRDFIDRAASVTAALPGVSILPHVEEKLVVAFGSQYGLCGALNERVLEAAGQALEELAGVVGIIYAGRRISDQAPPSAGVPVDGIDAPGSVDGLDETISELLTMIYGKYRENAFGELYFVYPTFAAEALTVVRHQVLPPSFRPENGRADTPILYLPPSEVMEGLIEEYVYVQLYATALETVIAENESRMRSMDHAEKNIRKRVDELTSSYNYAIQEEVTGELIEIIGGYEATRKKE